MRAGARRSARAVLAAVCVYAPGCSSLLGIENLGGPGDAPGGDVPGDGSGDGPLAQITVSGVLTANFSGTPTVAAPVELQLTSTGAVAKSGTADNMGMFSLSIPTAFPIDVVLRVSGSQSNVPDDYVYFPAPLSSDRRVSLLMPTRSDLQALAAQFSAPYDNNSVFLMITILDGTGAPVVGESLTGNLPGVTTYYYPGAMNGATGPTGRVVILTSVTSPGRAEVHVSSSGPVAIRPYTLYLVAGAVLHLEMRP